MKEAHMQAVQMRADAERATLTLMGDVGFEIQPAAVAAALRQAGKRPLTVHVHSYGGDALAGIAIHNMISRHEGAKTVVVEGIAASAASLIAMAGDRIVMPANAFLMIHEAWGLAVGGADALRGQADLLDMISAAYRRTYAARSGKDEDEVAALMAAETWFTAEDAVAAGFATESAEPAEMRADASRLARFTRVPAGLSACAAHTTTTTPPAPPASPEEVRMTEPVPQAGGQPPAPIPPAAPLVPQAATLAQLEEIAARGRLGSDFVVAQMRAGATVQAATDAVIDAMAANRPEPVGPSVVVTRDAGDTLRARLSSAFNATVTGRAPAESEREFAGVGFHGVIRELLAASGERNVHRLSGMDLVNRIFAAGGHTTSDFAGVLANSLNKTVRDLYGAFPNTWSSWCDEVEVADYKQITAATIGQFSELDVIAEGGQVRVGTIAEDLPELYAVSERGGLMPVSKQALVNDDLRALTRSAQDMALAAYTTLRRTVFGILTTNAAMADTIALFNASHSNLATASALDAAAFGALRTLLQNQVGPARAGRTASPLPPVQSVALLCGPARETRALELTTPLIVPNAVGNALPTAYRSSTSVVVEPMLSTGNNPFYMARTEPGMRVVEIAYIRGMRTPQVTQAERIDYTGVTFRCLFDFGAKAVTWRTAAANLGT
jgi:ATP-dependent protease ClpP protease subunit